MRVRRLIYNKKNKRLPNGWLLFSKSCKGRNNSNDNNNVLDAVPHRPMQNRTNGPVVESTSGMKALTGSIIKIKPTLLAIEQRHLDFHEQARRDMLAERARVYAKWWEAVECLEQKEIKQLKQFIDFSLNAIFLALKVFSRKTLKISSLYNNATIFLRGLRLKTSVPVILVLNLSAGHFANWPSWRPQRFPMYAFIFNRRKLKYWLVWLGSTHLQKLERRIAARISAW